MHSLSMAQDILRASLDEAQKHNGKRIKAISLKIADEDFGESESLQFCLEALSKGTIAEGALINIELVGVNTGGDVNHPRRHGEELLSVSLELD
jgi:hydrogenase nickel incorporation protein HypA/HybF